MKTDSLFYRLFQRNPKIALELLGLDFSGDSYWFGSEEIKQTAFRLDGVFTPLTDNPEQPIIFAEVQYQPDDDFYGRFFTEITLYLYQHKLNRDWIALVIYPNRSIEKMPKRDFQHFIGLPPLRRIYLEDYQQTPALSLNLALIRLISCPENQAIQLARDLTEQHEIDTETLDFIETILIYKLPRLIREEIRQMLNLQDIELKQTRFYQEAWGEGRQEGRQEGREEGRLEGEQILLQRILNRRFGQLPESIQKQIKQATIEQLEDWMYRLLDASTLDSIFAKEN